MATKEDFYQAYGKFCENNELSSRPFQSLTKEQVRVSRFKENSAISNNEYEYWKNFFLTGLDFHTECADLNQNKELFTSVLAELVNCEYKNIFEPMCQSGIFGSFIAGSIKGSTYIGIDYNEEGVRKAKEFKDNNGLENAVFEKGNLFTYHGKGHEVLIGRYILNGEEEVLNEESIDKFHLDFITEQSDRIILIQTVSKPKNVELYRQVFDDIDYDFEILQEPIALNSRAGKFAFAFKATR